jgi:dextransucrase
METKSPYYSAISDLLKARESYASGAQVVSSYTSNLSETAGENLISSVRQGTDRGTGLGVVVGNSPDLDTMVKVPMGALHANQQYVDALGYHSETLTTDAKGNLTVPVQGSSTVTVNGYLGVWMPKSDQASPSPEPTATTSPSPQPTETTPSTPAMQPVTPTVPATATGPVATLTRELISDRSLRFGSSTTLAASVDVGATGTVRFTQGNKTLAVGTLKNGLVTVTTPATLKVGKHAIRARYSGDETHRASVSAYSVLTVSKAKTKVSVKKRSAVAGSKPRLTVSTKALANGDAVTGKVRVYVNKKAVKTVTLHAKNHGKISVTLPKTYSKKFTVKVKYLGSSKVAAVSSKTVKVTPHKR